MNSVFALLALPPILKGLFAILLSGSVFPLCGVMVLRLNLVPLRYMLMHGVILGGAVSLALSLPLVPVTILINILLVLFMLLVTKDTSYGFGSGSAAAMVMSMAIASIIMHVADVPAKDTLSLLWGSPYALTISDLAILCGICVILLLYLALNFQRILSLFYSQEISRSLGINVRFHYTIMVLIIALVVALAMKLLGAFLIDALLVLPVLTAEQFLSKLKKGQGIKKLFLASSVTGFLSAATGYIISLALDLPPGGTIAVLSGLLYLASFIRLF